MPTLQSKSSPKYLVVDDEIVNKDEREEFIKPTRLPLEAGIFVETYEEALKALESSSNIILCFIDIRIPLNKRDKDDKDYGEEKDWPEMARELIDLKNKYGIRLLKQIKNIDTFIYSAYAKKRALQEEAEQYDFVKDYFQKPSTPNNLFEKIQPYLKLFRRETTVSLSPKSFDYSVLDDETVAFVQSRTVEIRKLAKRAAEDIFWIGSYLLEVKEKLDYGHFRAWLEAEFTWGSIRTAARFMSVAHKFGRGDRLTQLDILPSALYILASPSTPEEAVAEVLERAKQGETIAEKKAKEIKAKYKALKKPTDSAVQPKNINQSASIQTESSWNTLNVDSVSEPSSGLPKKKDKAKQEILAVVPSQKAVKNSWWQLGEHHRLFCGESKEPEFLKRLPKDIALMINFLPKNDLSLIPLIKSTSTLTFHSEHKDLDLDSLIRDSLETSTTVKDIVVLNYIYDVGLLELVEGLGCYFWGAEPGLEKCNRILTIWREKGSVMRIKN